MSKYALCIGINYYDTPFELKGCINDVHEWVKTLTAHGFSCETLIESQATKSAICKKIVELLGQLRYEGDVGVITFSGHGTQVPDLDNDEEDHLDEALVPFDFHKGNFLLDDGLAELFFAIPSQTHVLFVTDCCHSGSMYRSTFPLLLNDMRPRYVPTLYLVRNFLLPKEHFSHKEKPLDRLVHFAACQAHELAVENNQNGKHNGLFTRTLLEVLRKEDKPRSYREWFDRTCFLLEEKKAKQKPQLFAYETIAELFLL